LADLIADFFLAVLRAFLVLSNGTQDPYQLRDNASDQRLWPGFRSEIKKELILKQQKHTQTVAIEDIK
jgi:hypothetical protein